MKGPSCISCRGETEIFQDGPTNFLAQCLDCQQIQSLPGAMIDMFLVWIAEYEAEAQAKKRLDGSHSHMTIIEQKAARAQETQQ